MCLTEEMDKVEVKTAIKYFIKILGDAARSFFTPVFSRFSPFKLLFDSKSKTNFRGK